MKNNVRGNEIYENNSNIHMERLQKSMKILYKNLKSTQLYIKLKITEMCTTCSANGQRQTVGHINLLKPTGHVMNQQFNIQQLYVLPTLHLCVLYLSENK